LLKKSFITGTSTLQPLYLLYIHAILIPNWGDLVFVIYALPFVIPVETGIQQ